MPPQKQTNIRLDELTSEWVETIAFIHRRSVADELRGAVEEWVEKHRDDPRVRAARELRDPTGEEQASVSSLEAKRKRRSRGSDA